MRQGSTQHKHSLRQQVRFQAKAFLAAIFIVIVIAIGCQPAAAQRCHISPSLPIAVSAGGSYTFSADCGTDIVWTLTGDGNLTSDGTYYAPQSVRAPNQDRGCQVSPLNSPYNIPVDNLPADQLHTDIWLQRAAQDHPEISSYHTLRFLPQMTTFYSNVVDNDTPQELMHFYYPQSSYGYQDSPFPVPSERTMVMQTGTRVDPSIAYDRHLFTINKDTCETTEIYNFYVDFKTASFSSGSPTRVSWTTNTIWEIPQGYLVYISGATGTWSLANGSWRLTPTGTNSGTLPFDSSQWGPAPSGMVMSSTASGCNTCNSAGGQKFRPTSYAQLGGVDAAGLPIGALSVKTEEWYAATRAGRNDLGHAIRTTLSNDYLSARNIWPASLYALSVAGFSNPLTAATNSNPVIFTATYDLSQSLPCDHYTYSAGCQFHISISGIPSSDDWSAANGNKVATAIDDYHFSVDLDTRTFGAFPGAASRFDFFPYGATVRLKSSFDVDALCSSSDLDDWCPYAKVYLNTIKKYGMVIADGTIPYDNWNSGIMASEFHPDVLLDAAWQIRRWGGLQPFEQYLEVVDRSSQQEFGDLGRYQDSKVNRTTVSVCGSYGCDSTDILLQGTTIGTDKERLLLASGVSYQLNVWVHGNVSSELNYSVDSGIPGASVSSSGMLTMPNCTIKQHGMVTVTSVADPDALPLYIDIGCLPVSSDGGYRLALGNYSGDYVDSSNNTWWGNWREGMFYNEYQAPGTSWGPQAGTWEGQSGCSNDTWSGPDSQLFSRSISYKGDTLVELVVPNGTYNLTLYGEPGWAGFGPNHTCPSGPGLNVYDWLVQGRTVGSLEDGYVLAGQNYKGYTLPATATVTDNVLSTSGRMRAISSYGMSWSSLLIAPATLPDLTITTSSLPKAYPRIPYVGHLNASNGFPPYTWSLASGSPPLPPGLLISNTGLIFGRPSDPRGGTYPITVQVNDSQNNTATKDLTIRVCHAGQLC